MFTVFRDADESEKRMSLLEFITDHVTLRDSNGVLRKLSSKRDLMRLNITSEAGRYAAGIIRDYLDLTKQGFCLTYAKSRTILFLSEEPSGKIVDTLETGRREGIVYDPLCDNYEAPHKDGTRHKTFAGGTESNPSHYKIKDLWTMLGRHYIDLGRVISEEEFYRKIAEDIAKMASAKKEEF